MAWKRERVVAEATDPAVLTASISVKAYQTDEAFEKGTLKMSTISMEC